MTQISSKDGLRAALNLVLAPAMMVVSNLPMLFDIGRSPSEFSDQNNSLLVPFGIAFSIWLPIFILAIIYGFVQFSAKNRSRAEFRDTGWWTAAGFGFVTLWSIISGFAPDNLVLWGTALTFVPIVYCLITAMLKITAHKSSLSPSEGYTVWLPISLIAGWTSIAMFLNFTPIATEILVGFRERPAVAAVIMLSIALLFAVTFIRKSRGNRAYAFPIAWGLFWLAFARFGAKEPNETVAIAAVMGFLIILGATVYYGRRQAPEKI